jgi:DNA-binding NtrC family response regulator
MALSNQALRRVSAVAVLPSAECCREMRQIFDHTKWTLFTAENLRTGIGVIENESVGVVITEARLPDGDWRDLLSYLQHLAIAPRLLVTSRTAGELLWAEVLNLGGYDVLAQPLDFQEVTRAIGLAWLNWKGEWQQRPSGLRTRHAGGA